MNQTTTLQPSDRGRHPFLLDAATSALIVVDMQETFLNVMHARETLTANVLLLVKTAQLLHIPIVLTTQYAQRMGAILPEILDSAKGESESAPEPIDKLVFSCFGSREFRDTILYSGRSQILVCGLETHICVSQTAHDLLHAGYQVHVSPDATSSRTVEKHKLGMERIRDAGIRPIAAEAAVYEWLYAAGTPEFKAVLPWVK